MQVVVTGATGLLGIPLVEYLASRGHGVVALYHEHPAWTAARPDVVFAACDLRSAESVRDVLSTHGRAIDLIVHCAAKTDIDLSEKDHLSAYLANVVATRNLVTFAGGI